MVKKKILTPAEELAQVLRIKFEGNAGADIISSDKFERINHFLARKDVSPQLKFVADYHANLFGMGEHIEYPGDDYYNTWAEDNGYD